MEHLSIQRASVLLHGAAKGSVDQVVGVLFVVGGKVSIKGGFEQGNRCFGVICARHGLFEPVGEIAFDLGDSGCNAALDDLHMLGGFILDRFKGALRWF
jgi:hypothetical protein